MFSKVELLSKKWKLIGDKLNYHFPSKWLIIYYMVTVMFSSMEIMLVVDPIFFCGSDIFGGFNLFFVGGSDNPTIMVVSLTLTYYRVTSSPPARHIAWHHNVSLFLFFVCFFLCVIVCCCKFVIGWHHNVSSFLFVIVFYCDFVIDWHHNVSFFLFVIVFVIVILLSPGTIMWVLFACYRPIILIKYHL